jgi:hypothetical protein
MKRIRRSWVSEGEIGSFYWFKSDGYMMLAAFNRALVFTKGEKRTYVNHVQSRSFGVAGWEITYLGRSLEEGE